ncbi:hypothetical protein Deipe_4286 (plasmid) [Deinococcus peraridilitoris DSM 19664]|uniref:Uncharacterized protein n=1 Tax=Deinococcus peraridilitoris (strain DSM 19664 / LMG 22246 / CIP 109416 / KR-200) TaxID=937777 RepID=L0A895_DEIPD|nr:hypothetical protein Deipe_4286 [Deinococcus peraridilitoris DSM 19664]
MRHLRQTLTVLLIVTLTPGAIAQTNKTSTASVPPRTWEGTLTNDGNTTFHTKMRVTFVQHRNSLTGELYGYDQKTNRYLRVGPIKGSVNGTTASWVLVTADGHGTMAINGSFNGKTFRGRHTTAITGSGVAKGNVALSSVGVSSTPPKPSAADARTNPGNRESRERTPQVATSAKQAAPAAPPSTQARPSRRSSTNAAVTRRQDAALRNKPSPMSTRKMATPALPPKATTAARSGSRATNVPFTSETSKASVSSDPARPSRVTTPAKAGARDSKVNSSRVVSRAKQANRKASSSSPASSAKGATPHRALVQTPAAFKATPSLTTTTKTQPRITTPAEVIKTQTTARRESEATGALKAPIRSQASVRPAPQQYKARAESIPVSESIQRARASDQRVQGVLQGRLGASRP